MKNSLIVLKTVRNKTLIEALMQGGTKIIQTYYFWEQIKKLEILEPSIMRGLKCVIYSKNNKN